MNRFCESCRTVNRAGRTKSARAKSDDRLGLDELGTV